ncbi:putative thiosulfate sulfurtransferase [Gemmatimonas aurantiaca T-27]|nr:rhodanese-like domain-containing protein [Gemmatimonas aurantiaca]BAH40275.1 putative thiosulfate sulfurtransferase [Gemmatimonas aurantiaca T-27]
MTMPVRAPLAGLCSLTAPAFRVALTAVALTLTSGFMPHAAQAQSPAPSPLKIVSTEWLAERLSDPRLVIIQVEGKNSPDVVRIPGARVIPYSALTTRRGPLTTELPDVDSLASLFRNLGVSDASTVVITTSQESPMAARALMSLDYLGHGSMAFLDGGVARWTAQNRRTTTEAPVVTRGTFTPRVRQDLVATADWISGAQQQGRIALIDTRTDGEYAGGGNRSGMPSAGHLQGARQLEWEQLFTDEKHFQLRDSTQLRQLYTERMRGGDTVVTYCWVGYRASMTYVAARALGLPARFYDGSYQDWQQRQLPVVAGTSPRE